MDVCSQRRRRRRSIRRGRCSTGRDGGPPGPGVGGEHPQANARTRGNERARARMQPHNHSRTRPRTYTRTQARKRAHTQTHTRTHAYTHARTRTRARTDTRTGASKWRRKSSLVADTFTWRRRGAAGRANNLIKNLFTSHKIIAGRRQVRLHTRTRRRVGGQAAQGPEREGRDAWEGREDRERHQEKEQEKEQEKRDWWEG